MNIKIGLWLLALIGSAGVSRAASFDERNPCQHLLSLNLKRDDIGYELDLNSKIKLNLQQTTDNQTLCLDTILEKAGYNFIAEDETMSVNELTDNERSVSLSVAMLRKHPGMHFSIGGTDHTAGSDNSILPIAAAHR